MEESNRFLVGVEVVIKKFGPLPGLVGEEFGNAVRLESSDFGRLTNFRATTARWRKAVATSVALNSSVARAR